MSPSHRELVEVQLTARDGVHVDSVAVGVEDAAAGTEGLARLRGCSACSSDRPELGERPSTNRRYVCHTTAVTATMHETYVPPRVPPRLEICWCWFVHVAPVLDKCCGSAVPLVAKGRAAVACCRAIDAAPAAVTDQSWVNDPVQT